MTKARFQKKKGKKWNFPLRGEGGSGWVDFPLRKKKEKKSKDDQNGLIHPEN